MMKAPSVASLLAAAALALPLAAASAAPPPVPPWQAALGVDHRLTGVLWAPATGERLSAEELAARAARADYVLLGEVHDNPDTHRLQAWVLSEMIARGRKPAVAFEMFDSSQEKAITLHLQANPRDADGLARVLRWQESGWPDWTMYRPIVQAALDAGLPVLPANLPRDAVREIARGKGVPESLRDEMAQAGALPEEEADGLAQQLRDSHCGHLPEAMIAPMSEAQKARDLTMTRALRSGAALPETDGAVLIAGAGHTRADRAVPWHLARIEPEADILSVAFVEVEEGETDPAAYGELYGKPALPFDIVWFTPRQDRPDPCEEMARQMKNGERNKSE